MAKLLLKFNAAIIREVQISKGELTIGRKSDNDIVIDNPAVSGHHARVIKQGDEFLIEDLNSTNGTFLHDRKILKTVLHHKDAVGIAKHILQFIDEAEAARSQSSSTESVSSDETMVLSPTPQKTITPPKKQESIRETVGGLRVIAGESNANSFSLAGLTTYIGKSNQANIRIKGFFAPDMAGCVARKPEGYFLKVIKAKSVKYNGQILEDQVELKEGDLIEVGNLKLVYFNQDANGPLSG